MQPIKLKEILFNQDDFPVNEPDQTKVPKSIKVELQPDSSWKK
jgi:hypothetical protein